MYNQDDNKRFTVDIATLLYSHHLPSLLYVDRDELLYCPESSLSLSQQRDYQHRVIESSLLGADQLLFPRFNYGSVVKISSASSITDVFIQNILQDCVLSSYQKKSISSYFGCYSDVAVHKKKEKALYHLDSCPFHELHFACIRCRCNNTLINSKRSPEK
jgi:hypothetical protein